MELQTIVNEIKESVAVKTAVYEDKNIHNQLLKLAEWSISCLKNGGKIIFCGNGGSFADSQHLAAELISRLRFDRDALASVALGTNSSNLTAIGNDYGYEHVFEREILALGKAEDIFIPISTSGNSKNVLLAVAAAKAKGLKCMGFTGGTGGKLAELCECLVVPSSKTDKIQEIHIMFGHILCHLIETEIFAKK
jgi:D-sedoheptulose 7-phosphate isomerase